MSFILLLLLMFCLAGFSRPLCRAMGGALAFVRDPSHRVLPGDPWDMFLAQMRRRLRLWGWIWAGAAVGLSALIAAWPQFFSNSVNWYLAVYLFCTVLSVILGAWILIVILAMNCAPRMNEVAATAISGVGGAVFYIAICIGWVVAADQLIRLYKLPQWIYYWRIEVRGPNTYYSAQYLIFQFYILALLVPALWGMWRQTRRKGAAWFRFEE